MLPVQGVARATLRGKDNRSSPGRIKIDQQTNASLTWSIPVEIISIIFGFASRSSQDPISQSITVSHVCGRWRQISLSMPSLWTFIFLSLPLTKNQLTRTCTWLIRSQNRPLDICMDFRDPSWDWDEASHIFGCKAMDSIMHLLVPQASRWRSIQLFTDTWAPIFTFLSRTTPIRSPLLQTIQLARCNEYFVAQGEVFQPAKLAHPVAWFRGGSGLRHLRHVSLSGVHVDWTWCGLTGLRELELKYHAWDVMPTLSEFRRILCANPGLERLAILGWGPRMNNTLEHEHGNNDLQTVSLPQLEELEFGFVDVAEAIKLLSLFCLPSLRIFSIEDVAYGIQLCQPQDCSRLFGHLVEMGVAERASSCVPLASLRELSLRCIHADATSIHSLFGHLCAVTSLCLDRVDAMSLVAMCSAVHACGRLQVLTLKDVDPATTALVLSSSTFPACLRVFLDIEDVDRDEEGDIEHCIGVVAAAS